MKMRYLLPILLLVTGIIITAGCNQSREQQNFGQEPQVTSSPTQKIPAIGTTPSDLTILVNRAAAYARENGRDKAITAFNDPKGAFVNDDVYVLAGAYDGTALAEPFHPELVGTNIKNMTDNFGVPFVRNQEETGQYGTGFVSDDYPNPVSNNHVEPKLSVVSDVDGTYYVGAGTYAGSGIVYPSTAIGPATRAYTVADLPAFVKKAVAYARANGREKALAAFEDPGGQFSDGELTIMALDYNSTVIANSLSPETAKNHINLINYHDSDAVPTVREMRDLPQNGGGYSYTVAAVKKNGKTDYAPKLDYAEPVDNSYWIFSGIIIPGYEQLRQGNATSITLRNYTSSDMFDQVSSAITYEQATGKERTMVEINNPNGQFVHLALFILGENFDGTLLAGPSWKDEIGKNWMNFTDSYGSKTTGVGINAIRNGTGFSHAIFPDTSTNYTASVPKRVYMKPVNDSWWIGRGIYGVLVA